MPQEKEKLKLKLEKKEKFPFCFSFKLKLIIRKMYSILSFVRSLQNIPRRDWGCMLNWRVVYQEQMDSCIIEWADKEAEVILSNNLLLICILVMHRCQMTWSLIFGGMSERLCGSIH